jgi:hypothetical protein
MGIFVFLTFMMVGFGAWDSGVIGKDGYNSDAWLHPDGTSQVYKLVEGD